MPSLIYNPQTKTLEFKLIASPVEDLFHHILLNLTNIALDNSEIAICCVSIGGICSVVFYTDNLRCNEIITDILFLQGDYRVYNSHYPGFLSQENFGNWQNTLKQIDKAGILKALYLDNKISRPYYLARTSNSLYGLVSDSLITHFKKNSILPEAITGLNLLPPRMIEELQRSF